MHSHLCNMLSVSSCLILRLKDQQRAQQVTQHLPAVPIILWPHQIGCIPQASLRPLVSADCICSHISQTSACCRACASLYAVEIPLAS